MPIKAANRVFFPTVPLAVASTSTAAAAASVAVASTFALSSACRWDLWENFWTAFGEWGEWGEWGRRQCCRLMEFNRIDEHQLIMPQTRLTWHTNNSSGNSESLH
ncbi:hypothetical protein ACLKA7_005358 [Drosophila subpalustris]